MANPSLLGSVLLLGVWFLLIFVVAIIGLILFIVYMAKKRFSLRRLEDEPTKGQMLATIFTSPYMWLLFVALLGQFITAYLPSFIQ